MRIIAFSDSHGKHSAVTKLISQTQDSTDMYLFCGDGIKDVEYAVKQFPDIKLVKVRGNCDFCSCEQDIAAVDAGNSRIVIVHGHLQGVGYDTLELERLAYQNNAQLVVYGHTHQRDLRYKNGIYYLNPGSLALPRDGMPASYAAIDIIPAGILITHADS